MYMAHTLCSAFTWTMPEIFAVYCTIWSASSKCWYWCCYSDDPGAVPHRGRWKPESELSEKEKQARYIYSTCSISMCVWQQKPLIIIRITHEECAKITRNVSQSVLSSVCQLTFLYLNVARTYRCCMTVVHVLVWWCCCDGRLAINLYW